MPIVKLFIISLALLASACAYEEFSEPAFFIPGQPSDSGVPVDATAEDAGRDAQVPVDLGGDTGMDASTDASDAELADSGQDAGDAGVDMGCSNIVQELPGDTSGTECTPYVSDLSDTCDPVYQTGCDAGQVCRLRIVINGDGIPTGFTPGCSTFVCETMNGMAGDECVPETCAPGLHCLSNVCRRRCKLEGAIGCAPGEFCVGSSLSKEYGSCLDQCS